ncbi:MAG: SHOCT domain-containing protein [Angustibacter sp.]
MGDDQWWDHMRDGMDGRHMAGASWWPLWWVLLVLVVGAVVALVVLSTRPRTTPPAGPHAPLTGHGPPAGDPAEALLRERYARGEIDQAEYDERLARLRTSR